MVEGSLGDVYIAKDPMPLCFIAYRGAYLEIQFWGGLYHQLM
jgi:hypothetical protein